MIVDLELKHYEAMEKIHEDHDFPLPDPTSKLYFDQRAYLGPDGRLQAVGMLKLTSEAILIINKNLPSITRTKIVQDLLKLMLFDLDKAGLEDAHVFVEPENEKLIKFLKENSFIEVKQKPLYLPPRAQSKGATNGQG